MEFDERYLALMGLYKKLRLDPEKEELADKALSAASKLLKSGNISQEARETARYM